MLLEATSHKNITPRSGVVRFAVIDTVDVFEVPLVDEVLIGRGGTHDIVDVTLSTPAAYRKGVSRVHARIVLHGHRVYVQDQDSLNGTYLNGRLLEGGRFYPLRDGDTLTLGKLDCVIGLELPERGY